MHPRSTRELDETQRTAHGDAFHELVLESLADYVFVWDANGRVVFANTAVERLWGFGRDRWYGKTDGELGHGPELVRLLAQQRADVTQAAQPLSGEMLYTPPQTEESLWLEYCLSAIFGAPDQVRWIVCVARDITNRKHETTQLRTAEAQIKALFERLVSVQEDERRRIARDLHDQLGQQLTALRMNLEVFRLQSRADSAVLSQLERTQRLADDLDRTIDFLTWELRPDPLHHLGLVPALTQLVRTWAERFTIEADFQSIGAELPRLDSDVEVNLYRIAQEALHNVVKHAQAMRVSVLLEVSSARVTLTVEDDGRGFTLANDVAREHRLGLVSIRERAELIGGELEIDSSPGDVTTVTVRAPVRRHL